MNDKPVVAPTAIKTVHRPPVLPSECRMKNIPMEIILKYHNAGLTHGEIAKLVGCSEGNIKQRLRHVDNDPEATQHFQTHKSGVLGGLERRLSSLTDAEVKEMSPLQRLTGFGIVFDKKRLVDGQSTENVSHLHRHHENDGRIDEIMTRLEKLGVDVTIPESVRKTGG
jgi:hypothetical protein